MVTGIKVIDLLAPYAKGGKIGLFGGAGVGKTVLIMELIQTTFFQVHKISFFLDEKYVLLNLFHQPMLELLQWMLLKD